MKKSLMLVTGLSLALMQCKKEDPPQPPQAPEQAVLIANEGNFPEGVGSLSIYDPLEKSVENKVYQRANNQAPGSVINSLLSHNGHIFMVANGTGSVVVAENQNLERVTIFESLDNPRHIIPAGGQRYYVSSWGVEGVYILDMNTRSITGQIPTGRGAEQMLVLEEYILVVNSGGYTADSSLSVIDTRNDSVVAKVSVGHNPNSLVNLPQGQLAVLCSGIPDYNDMSRSTPGSLHFFDQNAFLADLQQGNTPQATAQLSFDQVERKPRGLQIDPAGQFLYYLDSYSSDLWRLNYPSGSVTDERWITGNYYAFWVHPENGDFYLSDPEGFTVNGRVDRFDSQGNRLDEFRAGVIPGFFAKK